MWLHLKTVPIVCEKGLRCEKEKGIFQDKDNNPTPANNRNK